MTKKRFSKCCPKIRDYGEEMSCTEVCDMLNRLNDENEKLKLENSGLKYALKYIKKIDVKIEVDDFND